MKGVSEMKMINKKSGEAVYFNPIRKNGKDAWSRVSAPRWSLAGTGKSSSPAPLLNTPRPRLTWPVTGSRAKPTANDIRRKQKSG